MYSGASDLWRKREEAAQKQAALEAEAIAAHKFKANPNPHRSPRVKCKKPASPPSRARKQPTVVASSLDLSAEALETVNQAPPSLRRSLSSERLDVLSHPGPSLRKSLSMERIETNQAAPPMRKSMSAHRLDAICQPKIRVEGNSDVNCTFTPSINAPNAVIEVNQSPPMRRSLSAERLELLSQPKIREERPVASKEATEAAEASEATGAVTNRKQEDMWRALNAIASANGTLVS